MATELGNDKGAVAAPDPDAQRKEEPVPEPVLPVQTLPPPPPAPGQPLQVAVGMQLIQQSALSFDRLDKGVQLAMLKIVGEMDTRAFQNAQEGIQRQQGLEIEKIKDGAVGRKHILVTIGLLMGATLLAGTVVTVLLINAAQPQLAHTVMMSGMAVISALLGGAGLRSLIGRKGSG